MFENANPALKGLPLGVKQKSILATCNYAARARGVSKLSSIFDAKKACPEIVIINGEDLTPFRDVSKRLWSVLRSYSWNDRVERLGLDEVFLDVTDIVAYNQELLNRNTLPHSFFQLSRHDLEKGFVFDGTRFCGCTEPFLNQEDITLALDNPLCVRLMLASHLAGHLRHRIEEEFGYTSSGGISTNKLLAKMVGSVHKPKNQTTLLSLHEDDIQNFMDRHKLRKVPGIGSRIAHLIQDHVIPAKESVTYDPHNMDTGAKVTVGQVRQYPFMSADQLERILDRPGAERGGGEKIWSLLHGVDNSEVKEASDVPTQISIEDTYMSRPLNTPAEILRELCALSTSLVRRMRTDLTVDDDSAYPSNGPAADTASTPTIQSSKQLNQLCWAAYPKTLRLSTRTRPKSGNPENFSRSSRSQSLPSFVLNFKDESVEAIGERLATDVLLPLFRRLNPERQGWNLALINICVTNMVMVAGPGEGGNGGPTGFKGRNIASMFRTQEDKLREWTVYDPTPVNDAPVASTNVEEFAENATWTEDEKGGSEEEEYLSMEVDPVSLDPDAADAWEEEDESYRCHICGHAIPVFAIPAHERFHAIGD